MAKQIIAVSDFVNKSDAKTLIISSAVSKALTNNAPFAGIAEIPLLEKAVENFLNAKDASSNGNRALIADKNAAKLVVVGFMKTIRRKVNLICAGNKALLSTTAFTLSSDVPPKPMTAPVATLTDSKTKDGLMAKVKGASKARSIYYQLSTDSTFDIGVIMEACTGKAFVFNNLRPATKYYLRVMAVGTKSQKLYSEVVCRVTQ